VEGAVYFAECLKMNATLQVLNMGRSEITSEGVHDLAEALKENKALKSLDIGGVFFFQSRPLLILLPLLVADNKIEAQGATHIAEALKVNRTLQNLDMKSK
jgi:Ran GTPase-activating protein (RanGAP) involved in mRNA processing and transport